MKKSLNIGLLTGGGDCPGLNAVIRAVVATGELKGHTYLGILDGWRGLVTGESIGLTKKEVSGIMQRGGTILGTSRTNPFKDKETEKAVLVNIKKLGLDVIIAIGGEDTLGVANKLSEKGIKVIGIPKTIDNDLPGTDFTFGFNTAVQTVTDAIDRITTTAESHDRVLVIEVMGRHTGWIATYAGIAGGADCILVPEHPFTIQEITTIVEKRREVGKLYTIVVVSEGAKLIEENKETCVLSSDRVDEFGHEQLGGIGDTIGKLIEKEVGCETRVTVLGHVQRGGTPTAEDRILSTRFGVAAMRCVDRGEFGTLISLQGGKIVEMPLSCVAEEIKTVDEDIFELAKIFQY